MRRFTVERRHSRIAASAARGMRAAGFSASAIRKALGLTPAAYSAAISRSRTDLWGTLSGEIRRLLAE